MPNIFFILRKTSRKTYNISLDNIKLRLSLIEKVSGYISLQKC